MTVEEKKLTLNWTIIGIAVTTLITVAFQWQDLKTTVTQGQSDMTWVKQKFNDQDKINANVNSTLFSLATKIGVDEGTISQSNKKSGF